MRAVGNVIFGADTRSLDQVKTDAQATLAAIRYAQSATFAYTSGGGSVVQGVASDDTAQSRLVATLSFMQADGGSGTVGWELTPTNFAQMSMAQLTAMGAQMGAHVQACWANQLALGTRIATAPDIASVQVIDLHSGWPV